MEVCNRDLCSWPAVPKRSIRWEGGRGGGGGLVQKGEHNKKWPGSEQKPRLTGDNVWPDRHRQYIYENKMKPCTGVVERTKYVQCSGIA